MNDTKLTVRIPRDLLDNIKLFAAKNNTSLTKLIEAYLRRFPINSILANAPIVQRLSGILSANVTIQDYEHYIDNKYGQ